MELASGLNTATTIIFIHGIIFCLTMMTTTANFLEVGSDEIAGEERQRSIRETPPSPAAGSPTKKATCGATALRLNLDLNRLHGKWYPTEASDSAYFLWMSSLYGAGKGSEAAMTGPTCIVMDFKAGPEENTLNVELSHKLKSTTVQAALLGDSFHPGRSKWVISWPNGEDTLTSIVATGSVKSDSSYDWMLTVDCDLNGTLSPDWAIFSREQGLSAEAIDAIKAILDGIGSLRLTKFRQTKANDCTSN